MALTFAETTWPRRRLRKRGRRRRRVGQRKAREYMLFLGARLVVSEACHSEEDEEEKKKEKEEEEEAEETEGGSAGRRVRRDYGQAHCCGCWGGSVSKTWRQTPAEQTRAAEETRACLTATQTSHSPSRGSKQKRRNAETASSQACRT
jgi:hypothetical protein